MTVIDTSVCIWMYSFTIHFNQPVTSCTLSYSPCRRCKSMLIVQIRLQEVDLLAEDGVDQIEGRGVDHLQEGGNASLEDLVLDVVIGNDVVMILLMVGLARENPLLFGGEQVWCNLLLENALLEMMVFLSHYNLFSFEVLLISECSCDVWTC